MILPAKCSSQETPIGPAGLPGVVPSKPLSPLDGVRELQHDASCNSSLAHTEGEKDSPGEYCLGLKQLALQSVLLFVSWVSLALLHPNGCPLLLLFAIILSRLHLGWLLCCVLRMLLPRCSKDPPEGSKEPHQGRLSVLLGHLGDRCWSRLPLRYWHCAFYLLLLLAAFWAASVVWDDSQEGLQALQGGGGMLLPSTQAWLGGGLPPLLLNSDSPQHVKIAATAVARGREASDHLLWLLHTAPQQHFGKMLLWLRALTFGLNSFLLQPFLAILRHTGFIASVNGTCSLSDAPEASPDTESPHEGWLLWLQVAIQNAVRSLPSTAHTFLCGGGARGGLSTEEEATVWSKSALEAPLDFGVEGSVVEMGPYCVALLLLLVYALSTTLHRVCLAGFAALRSLLLVWGIDQASSSTRPWDECLAVACRSSLTAFAVAFVLLALLWSAAAATAKGGALVGWVWRRMFGRKAIEPARNSHHRAGDYSSNSRNTRVHTGSHRGAGGLEVLAACVTCWVLLLSDREFVMFTWATMQPLRLSLLSTVLLLRLPSSQVAALLTWPPPLREPALVLQRSQPLKIIDPVAVGSMLGCILAAAALRLVLLLLAKVGGLFRNPFASSCTAQPVGGLRLLGVSRGQWGVRNSPSGGDSPTPNSLLQKMQEQNRVIAELQVSLKNERCRATLAEERIAKLEEEARAQIAKAPPEGHANNHAHTRPDKPQADASPAFAVAEKISRGKVRQNQQQDHGEQQHEQQEHPKQHQSQEQQPKQQQQQESGSPAEGEQQQASEAAQQQTRLYVEELREARVQLEVLQSQLRGAQNQLSELQRKRDREASAYERRQEQLEAEAAQWREKEGEARAERELLKADLAEAARKLEGLRQAQWEQQRQAGSAQAEDKAQIQRMTQLLQKQTEDLAKKTAEINELRGKLTQVASSYARRPTRLVDSQSQTPLVQREGLLGLTEGPAPTEVVEQVLMELNGITHRIKQNVENDTKTVNFHKTHFSSLAKLSYASGAAASANISEDSEPPPNPSKSVTSLHNREERHAPDSVLCIIVPPFSSRLLCISRLVTTGLYSMFVS